MNLTSSTKQNQTNATTTPNPTQMNVTKACYLTKMNRAERIHSNNRIEHVDLFVLFWLDSYDEHVRVDKAGAALHGCSQLNYYPNQLPSQQ